MTLGRHVTVIGGGIAGLAATRALVASDPSLVVRLLEASPRLGGHLATSPFAGRPAVDESADCFLARLPHARSLAAAAGLDDLVEPATQRASIWHERLHDIPHGQLLGIPGRLTPLLRASVLSWRGKARALREPLIGSTETGDSLGGLVRHRFGDELHDRLVDSLVGSIYAADTDRFSLSMVPQLAELAEQRTSLLLGARAAMRRRQRGPVFLAPRRGMGELASAVADDACSLGATLELDHPVAAVEPDGRRWRVDGEPTDAVILACPARAASACLGAASAALAELLGGLGAADVAIVTVAVASEAWPQRLAGRSGYLVPKSVQRSVTAVSFATQKWAHLADGSTELLRISLGRDGAPVPDLDDRQLVGRAVGEVSRHVGAELSPVDARISRWPRAFPQYRPGHRTWLEAVRRVTPPGIVPAGASYRGIGVPACIESGEQAAATTIQHLASMRQ